MTTEYAIDYKNDWYQSDKPDYKEFNENLPEYWDMVYEDRMIEIFNLNPNAKTMLEVGSGMGRAMKQFKKWGFEVMGIEPSQYASNLAKAEGLDIINDYFDYVKVDHKFDVIYFEQVLSHIPDINKALTKAKSMLSPGGLIVFEEPNDYSPLQFMVNKGEYWVTKDHVNYLNFSTIDGILNHLGLVAVKKTATYPMEFFELMGEPYIGNDDAGRKVHEKRYLLLSSMGRSMRQQFESKCAEMGIGRDMVIYCKEKEILNTEENLKGVIQ